MSNQHRTAACPTADAVTQAGTLNNSRFESRCLPAVYVAGRRITFSGAEGMALPPPSILYSSFRILHS